MDFQRFAMSHEKPIHLLDVHTLRCIYLFIHSKHVERKPSNRWKPLRAFEILMIANETGMQTNKQKKMHVYKTKCDACL